MLATTWEIVRRFCWAWELESECALVNTLETVRAVAVGTTPLQSITACLVALMAGTFPTRWIVAQKLLLIPQRNPCAAIYSSMRLRERRRELREGYGCGERFRKADVRPNVAP